MRIDDSLKDRAPKLPKGYKLEGLAESKILLKLVDPDPNNRPTIETIKGMLGEWSEKLNDPNSLVWTLLDYLFNFKYK